MNNCLNCGESTNNPKFCGRSCSATYTNKQNPKRTRQGLTHCTRCGKKFTKEWSKKFCSNACALANRKEAYLSEWLLTGIAPDLIREGTVIREYLYEQQDNTCALCPQGREWNGKRLNFIMDHIDGNSMDSSRTNLRLVCPNCDFQLPTSKGKNVGNGRYRRRQRYAEGKSR